MACFWNCSFYSNFALYMYNISVNKHFFECIENTFYKNIFYFTKAAHILSLKLNVVFYN